MLFIEAVSRFASGFAGGLIFAAIGLGKAISGGEKIKPQVMLKTLIIAGLVSGVTVLSGWTKDDSEAFLTGAGITSLVDLGTKALYRLIKQKYKTGNDVA